MMCDVSRGPGSGSADPAQPVVNAASSSALCMVASPQQSMTLRMKNALMYAGKINIYSDLDLPLSARVRRQRC